MGAWRAISEAIGCRMHCFSCVGRRHDRWHGGSMDVGEGRVGRGGGGLAINCTVVVALWRAGSFILLMGHCGSSTATVYSWSTLVL